MSSLAIANHQLGEQVNFRKYPKYSKIVFEYPNIQFTNGTVIAGLFRMLCPWKSMLPRHRKCVRDNFECN